jgi:redox-sensitive bicupin YhaK (pirin superfamily)
MIKRIDHSKMGRGQHGWLDSHFHFSFAEYYNPKNIQFGALRVINDDQVQPGTGFDTHPHRDMEILSYVVHGELTHADSMGNSSTLSRGHVQYMSAGTGVLHSEHNFGHELLRFLQIWIIPDKGGHAPTYGEFRFPWESRHGRWLAVASGKNGPEAPIKLHEDVNVFATEIPAGNELEFKVNRGRQAYLVLMEGSAAIGGQRLFERDGMEIVEEDIVIKADSSVSVHALILEMKKDPSEVDDKKALEEELILL